MGDSGAESFAIMCPCLMPFLVQYARDPVPTKAATRRHTLCQHLPKEFSQGMFRAVVACVSSL